MTLFEDKYFEKFAFTKSQIKKNFDNALKDLRISKEDKIPEVKFNYAYSALIKGGIALASFHGRKIKSVPGHHVKIIEITAKVLKNEAVNTMGNAMRSKRNKDLYAGGIDISEKESREFIDFVSTAIAKIEELVF